MVSSRESRRNRLNFAISTQVSLSIIPALPSIHKMRANQRWLMALNAQKYEPNGAER